MSTGRYVQRRQSGINSLYFAITVMFRCFHDLTTTTVYFSENRYDTNGLQKHNWATWWCCTVDGAAVYQSNSVSNLQQQMLLRCGSSVRVRWHGDAKLLSTCTSNSHQHAHHWQNYGYLVFRHSVAVSGRVNPGHLARSSRCTQF